MSEKIHPNFENVKGEIFWAVRNEMARTVEDFLSRRTRMLLMDAKASIEAAPLVAEIMAGELNQKQNWIDFQINHYKLIAHNYLVN